MAVRRFWRGICELSEQHPGARVAIATHSGCIRAFAVAALGYDPGEPYNTEHVRVKLYGTPRQPRPGMSATITYRNRVQEWKVPDPAALPTWGHEHEWRPVEITPTESDIGTDTSTRDDAPRELTYTLWFDEFDESHVHCIGGKNASLGAMTRAGLPVPAGFAVTTHAYTHSMAGEHVGQAAHTLLDGIDVHDLQQLAEAAEAARAAVLHAGPSPAVADSIRRAYRELCARTGVDDVPVAVRSSATAEDQPDASFAGQQDTYLWVRGEDAVVAHVARCWASLFTDRAIAYRHENGYPHAEVHMSVAVQQMVLPKAAGVAFTLDPTNGDRSTIAIDSAFGVGESVVSGAVTPDNYKVDKVIFEITQRTVSAKECECVLDGDTLVHRPLDAERSLTASLTDDEIRAVARLARQAEKHYGRPQDVEWAVTVGDDGSSAVHLLQSRPETVWSSKPRTAGNASKSAIDGIVDTLLTPVRVRPE
jgi:pyruvate,water dikinase